MQRRDEKETSEILALSPSAVTMPRVSVTHKLFSVRITASLFFYFSSPNRRRRAFLWCPQTENDRRLGAPELVAPANPKPLPGL